eukprot:PhF_6_TR10795/c0_g1_i1/m.17363/K03514/PAPD5_7, TRF4; non-canonical poly(A) RNA polymerase PAPD5/7
MSTLSPLPSIGLFDRFAAHRGDLQEEPSMIEAPDTALQSILLSPELKQKLSERGKRLSEGHIPTQDEEESRRRELLTPFNMNGGGKPGEPTVNPSQRVAPWIRPEGYNPDPWIALHQEILDCVEYIKPTPQEMVLRNLVVHEVTAMCLQIWPTCVPRCFGSMGTQLLLPGSDIDICVSAVPEDVNNAITRIAEMVTTLKMCATAVPRVIRNTRVPLVKFVHGQTGFSVDISINADEGVANTEIVRDMLLYFPAAHHLIIIVKLFLQRRRLHEPYYGGIGSYATTLFVISFLQHHPYNQLATPHRSRITLGMLLTDFFRYYGSYFSVFNVGIRLTNGGSYFRKASNDSRGLVLEDPCNIENNVGQSARYCSSILKTFDTAYATMMSDVTDAWGEHSTSKLSRIVWVTQAEVERKKAILEIHDQWVMKHHGVRHLPFMQPDSQQMSSSTQPPMSSNYHTEPPKKSRRRNQKE